jgi:hypothetical protein
MSGSYRDVSQMLDELEASLASANDRTVEEFRDYHPEQVVAIDALRAVALIHDVSRHGDGHCVNCFDALGNQLRYPCPTMIHVIRVLAGVLHE